MSVQARGWLTALHSEDRVSQAVGTTIRVTNFLKSLPVRRQTALKDSTKQLAKIKRTLQAYALARPSVRLSLKVLKAKNEKGNWTYAPKSDASVLDAAVKIVGKGISDHCQWIVWDSSSIKLNGGSASEDEIELSDGASSNYRIETLIPKPDSGGSALQASEAGLTGLARSLEHLQRRPVCLGRLATSVLLERHPEAACPTIQILPPLLPLRHGRPKTHRSIPLHESRLPSWKL